MKRFLSAVVVLLLLQAASSRASEDRTFTVGIVPQQSATKLVRSWVPLLDVLSRESGVKLRFKTANDIAAFEDRLRIGEYDFAYMNPYHYVVFSESSGYIAMANERDKRIQGIIVVHKDTDITELGQLAGQTLAFPSSAAFAASILPRAELKNRSLAIEPRFVGSHDSVYHLVARRRYQAGGGIIRTFNAVNPQIRKQLRILWTSGKYTPHAFAAHKRVAIKTRQAVEAALTQLHGIASGKKHLDQLRLKGFKQARDQEWDDIRQLGIKTLY